MTTLKRLQREFESIQKESYEYFSANIVNNNYYEWDSLIIGPKDTPYENGIFKLKIYIPTEYPFKPPVCSFTTKIYHPNISESGQICLDILKTQWAPSLTISKVLLSILALLDSPNANDPLSPGAANLYKNNREEYNNTVKNWVYLYAL